MFGETSFEQKTAVYERANKKMSGYGILDRTGTRKNKRIIGAQVFLQYVLDYCSAATALPPKRGLPGQMMIAPLWKSILKSARSRSGFVPFEFIDENGEYKDSPQTTCFDY